MHGIDEHQSPRPREGCLGNRGLRQLSTRASWRPGRRLPDERSRRSCLRLSPDRAIRLLVSNSAIRTSPPASSAARAHGVKFASWSRLVRDDCIPGSPLRCQGSTHGKRQARHVLTKDDLGRVGVEQVGHCLPPGCGLWLLPGWMHRIRHRGCSLTVVEDPRSRAMATPLWHLRPTRPVEIRNRFAILTSLQRWELGADGVYVEGEWHRQTLDVTSDPPGCTLRDGSGTLRGSVVSG